MLGTPIITHSSEGVPVVQFLKLASLFSLPFVLMGFDLAWGVGEPHAIDLKKADPIDIAKDQVPPYLAARSFENAWAKEPSGEAGNQKQLDEDTKERATSYCLDKGFKTLVFFRLRDVAYENETHLMEVEEDGKKGETAATEVASLMGVAFSKNTLPPPIEYPNSKLLKIEVPFIQSSAPESPELIYPNTIFQELWCSQKTALELPAHSSLIEFQKSLSETDQASANKLIERQALILKASAAQIKIDEWVNKIKVESLVTLGETGQPITKSPIETPHSEYRELDTQVRSFLEFLSQRQKLDSRPRFSLDVQQNYTISRLIQMYKRLIELRYPNHEKERYSLAITPYNGYASNLYHLLYSIVELGVSSQVLDEVAVLFQTMSQPGRMLGCEWASFMRRILSQPLPHLALQSEAVEACIHSNFNEMILPLQALSENPVMHPEMQKKYIAWSKEKPNLIRIGMLSGMILNPGVQKENKKILCKMPSVIQEMNALQNDIRSSRMEQINRMERLSSYDRPNRRHRCVDAEWLEGQRKEEIEREKRERDFETKVIQLFKECGMTPYFW